jgi:hypothetical protein
MAGRKSPTTILGELREQRSWPNVPSTLEVMTVLSYVGEPGRRLDAKREVIRDLFPNAFNRTGIHIADALDTYGEF